LPKMFPGVLQQLCVALKRFVRDAPPTKI